MKTKKYIGESLTDKGFTLCLFETETGWVWTATREGGGKPLAAGYDIATKAEARKQAEAWLTRQSAN